jgi:predicted nucleic acid-binding protein
MRYLLDSNILIGFLNGDRKIINWILERKRENRFSLNISFISRIEVLSLRGLKNGQANELEKFLNSFYMTYLNDEIINLSAALRRKQILSLGDAVVAATTISNKLILVTNDKILVKKVKNFLEVLSI